VYRIHALEPGLRVIASRRIALDEDYFQDHFPGFPVVPGVLLTEMMGQAAAKALDSERRPRGKAMLAKITSASFRQWVQPGDEVMLHGEITANTERYANADCRAEVNGKPVAQASLFFTFVPASAFKGDLHDAVLEEFLAKSAT